MDEKTLLDAIRAIVREENTPINTRLDAMQTDISDMRADISDMQTSITDMQTDIAEVKDRVTRMEVVQENILSPNIQLLAEGHSVLVFKLDRLEDLPDQVEDIQSSVSVLKHVFKGHVHS